MSITLISISVYKIYVTKHIVYLTFFIIKVGTFKVDFG